MALCPYCKKRQLVKKTCGSPECQHKRALECGRKYFDKYLRKTDRRVSPAILRIRQQGRDLEGR